jgi:hypothetical protein
MEIHNVTLVTSLEFTSCPFLRQSALNTCRHKGLIQGSSVAARRWAQAAGCEEV